MTGDAETPKRTTQVPPTSDIAVPEHGTSESEAHETEADDGENREIKEPERLPDEQQAGAEPKVFVPAAVKAFLNTTFGQISTTVVGLLLAALGGWLSPIGDIIKEWIWREKIEIGEEIPANEHEARQLQFILQTKTRSGFSGGTITVSSPDHSISFEGDTRFVVPPAEGAIKVPDAGTLTIKPLTTGKHLVHVLLETRRNNRFEGNVAVSVSGINYESFVGTESVWSGNWSIILNGNSGVMKLIETSNRHLKGSVTFSDGDRYNVDPISWHDGTAFLIKMDGAEQTFLIRGKPCSVSNATEKWRILNGKVTVEKEGVAVSKPVKLTSIIERCDKMTDLQDTDGDGAFEAHIALQ